MKIDPKVMYATMSPWRLFFKAALPGMVSMLAMSIYGIFEGVFIGQRLGEAAFAAAGIAFPIVLINFSLADLIGVGAAVPISIALGKKDEETAGNVFTCSVILILVASVLMGGVMFFAAEGLSRLMGADDTLLPTAAKYIQTYAICSPLTTIFFAMDNFLRISGYLKESMILNVFFNAATIVLLLVFIIGMGMDVAGSALASCVAMCTCSVLALIPFLRGEAILRFQKPHFSLSMLKEIAACGSPVFLSNIAGRVTSIGINVSLMTLGVKALGEGGGTTAVATYSILMYAGEMCQPLIYGISDSLSPAIGFNRGAGRDDRVKSIARCGYVGSALISLIAVAAMFFFSEGIARLFVDAEDTALISLATHALRLFSLTYLVRWFPICAQSFLAAIEKPVQATVLSVCIALFFPFVTLALLWRLGLDGIWLNLFVSSLFSLVLGLILTRTAMKHPQKAENTKS